MRKEVQEQAIQNITTVITTVYDIYYNKNVPKKEHVVGKICRNYLSSNSKLASYVSQYINNNILDTGTPELYSWRGVIVDFTSLAERILNNFLVETRMKKERQSLNTIPKNFRKLVEEPKVRSYNINDRVFLINENTLCEGIVVGKQKANSYQIDSPIKYKVVILFSDESKRCVDFDLSEIFSSAGIS